jgi:hypothetical protein
MNAHRFTLTSLFFLGDLFLFCSTEATPILLRFVRKDGVAQVRFRKSLNA